MSRFLFRFAAAPRYRRQRHSKIRRQFIRVIGSQWQAFTETPKACSIDSRINGYPPMGKPAIIHHLPQYVTYCLHDNSLPDIRP